MTDTKITARLRPDVDRRLRAAALLQRARISRILNDALDAALPSLREIGALVARTDPGTEERQADGDRS
jgi:uncharacterized protein (DUF1778 family)